MGMAGKKGDDKLLSYSEDYKSPKIFDPDHGHFEIKLHKSASISKKVKKGPETSVLDFLYIIKIKHILSNFINHRVKHKLICESVSVHVFLSICGCEFKNEISGKFERTR